MERFMCPVCNGLYWRILTALSHCEGQKGPAAGLSPQTGQHNQVEFTDWDRQIYTTTIANWRAQSFIFTFQKQRYEKIISYPLCLTLCKEPGFMKTMFTDCSNCINSISYFRFEIYSVSIWSILLIIMIIMRLFTLVWSGRWPGDHYGDNDGVRVTTGTCLWSSQTLIDCHDNE